MAISITPLYAQTGSYTAQADRLLTQGNAQTAGTVNLPYNPPATTPVTGTVASAMAGELAVTTNGTADAKINIAAGGVWVASSSGQGSYYVYNDASVQLSLAAGSASQRIDLIVVQVNDPSNGGTGTLSGAITIVTGTPGGAAPATPSNAVALAQITIPTSFTTGSTVLASQIADVRPKGRLGRLGVQSNSTTYLPTASLQFGDTVVDNSQGSLKAYHEYAPYDTSATSFAIPTLASATSQAFTVVTNASGLTAGTRVRLSSAANPANFVEGTVTTHTGSVLTVQLDAKGGTGTITDWIVYAPGWVAQVSAASVGALNNAGTGRFAAAFYSPSTVAPTAPLTPGSLWYQTDTAALFMYSGTAWNQVVNNGTAWTTWTPTVVGVTAGTGATTQYVYKQTGKTVSFRFQITFGTTPSFTAPVTFTLPVTPATSSVPVAVGYYNGTGGPWPISAYYISSVMALYYNKPTATLNTNVGQGAVTTGATPVAPASGNILVITGTYEAA